MCLKEAVTNIVKHSHATTCSISIKQSQKKLLIKVHDNGIGLSEKPNWSKRTRLRGMKERLEFVNGTLISIRKMEQHYYIRVPNVIKQPRQEE